MKESDEKCNDFEVFLTLHLLFLSIYLLYYFTFEQKNIIYDFKI